MLVLKGLVCLWWDDFESVILFRDPAQPYQAPGSEAAARAELKFNKSLSEDASCWFGGLL